MQRCMRNVLYSMLPSACPSGTTVHTPNSARPRSASTKECIPCLAAPALTKPCHDAFTLPTADPHLELVQVNPSGGQLLLVGVLHGKGRRIQPFSAARAQMRRAGGLMHASRRPLPGRTGSSASCW